MYPPRDLPSYMPIQRGMSAEALSGEVPVPQFDLPDFPPMGGMPQAIGQPSGLGPAPPTPAGRGGMDPQMLAGLATLAFSLFGGPRPRASRKG